MDSIPDLQQMTTESPPHTAPAANPTPSPATNGAHPPYAEMITAAIAALKDKDGSSRQAIAKYIEKEYQNLPPTHSALLTHHLKRLKNQGQIMMIKHSYMLPNRSAHFQPPTPTNYHDDPDYAGSDAFPSAPENSSSALPKRKPGRPPKTRPDSGFHGPTQTPNVQSIDAGNEIQPYQPQFEHHFGDVHDFQNQTHSGAPGQDLQSHYGSGPEYQGTSVGAAEPIFVSLGLADDGVAPPQSENAGVSAKRGRGRPPKLASIRGPSGGGAGDAAGPDGGVAAAVAATSGGGSEVEAGSGAGSGRRGRPRKAGRPKLLSVMMGAGGLAKRSRGRPKRFGIGPVTVPLSGNVMRPRGRPKKAVRRPNVLSVNGGVSDGGLGSRQRGRPPKIKLGAQTSGMPSKTGPGTALLVTDPQELVAYQELKYKYEHLQSKVKEVVSVVKPYMSSEYENAALGALEELEALAGAADSDVQTQPPPPPPFVQN